MSSEPHNLGRRTFLTAAAAAASTGALLAATPNVSASDRDERRRGLRADIVLVHGA